MRRNVALSGVVVVWFVGSSCCCGGVTADTTTNNKLFSSYKPAGIQSGPDAIGGTYVAAATYSPDDNTGLLTGSTWGRYFESPSQLLDDSYDIYGTGGTQQQTNNVVEGCFLASVRLPGTSYAQVAEYEFNSGSQSQQATMFWSHRQRLSTPSSNEACNAVQYFSDSATILVAGHSEEIRNVTIRPNVLQEQTIQYGLLLAEEWDGDTVQDMNFNNIGGQLLDDSTGLIYPVAMAGRTNNLDEGLFVAFMESELSVAHHVDGGGQTQAQAQQQDPLQYLDYGSGYGFSVTRYDFAEEQVTARQTATKIRQSWLQSYNITTTTASTNNKNKKNSKEKKEPPQVFVNDMIRVANGLLVVVGTTNGYGPAFGATTDQGPDMDGFLVKISPSNGQLIIVPGFPSSYRIQSKHDKSNNKKRQQQQQSNDWVASICHDPNDAQHHVYIVGTTEGTMPMSTDVTHGTSAYLMKFDIRKVQPLWTKHISAESTVGVHHKGGVATTLPPIVRGMACAVTPDGQSVWVGGMVSEGNVVIAPGATTAAAVAYGGQDIFVAQIDTKTSDIVLMEQLGSTHDDELALHGGLVTDTAGNAVLIGNTYGSLFRTRTEHQPQEQQNFSDVFVMTVALFDGQTTLVNSSTGNSGETSSSTPSSPSKIHTSNTPSVSIVILIMVLVALIMVLRRRRRRHRGAFASTTTDRSRVSPYLQKFDIEDVELKHSATGGWHCTFVNRLAHGVVVSRNNNRNLSTKRLGRNNSRNTTSKSSDGLMRVPSLTDPSSTEELIFYNDTSLEDEDDDYYMDISNGSNASSLLHGGESGSAYEELIQAYNSTWTSRSSSTGVNASTRVPYSDEPDNDECIAPSSLRTTWGKEII